MKINYKNGTVSLEREGEGILGGIALWIVFIPMLILWLPIWLVFWLIKFIKNLYKNW